MEFRDVVARRRMCRNFLDRPIDPEVLRSLLEDATRAPSAGNSQGWELVALQGPDQTSLFWDASLPVERRAGFRWPGLLRAPVLVIPLADPDRYVRRYAEEDKAPTGLGEGAHAWPVPYWTVDTAFATMTLLHGVVDAGLGALFFGMFHREAEVMRVLGVPEGLVPLGVVAIGHPAPDEPGRSARRPHRSIDEVVHWGGFAQVPSGDPHTASSSSSITSSGESTHTET
ncbi:MAG: nitroreductase family protein [Acidimicrobiales bacterium]